MIMFQSLFYWKLLCDTIFSNCSIVNTSFNPCFIGSCSATIYNIRHMCDDECFNPCFIGSCSATAVFLFKDIQKQSFNPCFIGSCSATWTMEMNC